MDSRDAAFRKRIWAAFRQKLPSISTTIEEELAEHCPRLSEEFAKRGIGAIKVSSEIGEEAREKAAELQNEGRITSDRCVGVGGLEIIFTAKLEKMTVVTEEAQGRQDATFQLSAGSWGCGA